MKKNIKTILIDKINKSAWWHVNPQDVDAYKKRGKFLASTYAQAEFYGRPNDVSEKVSITNPIYGCSEIEILKIFFQKITKNYFIQSGVMLAIILPGLTLTQKCSTKQKEWVMMLLFYLATMV